MQTKPTAPPPTLEDDLSLEDAATSYILKHHVDNYHDKQPLPLPCVECTIAFARQQVSAARAEAVVEWLCELSEMWEFSRDASEFVAKFKPWLDAKLKEYDAKEMSEEAKR
jgi:hypothetical protein